MFMIRAKWRWHNLQFIQIQLMNESICRQNLLDSVTLPTFGRYAWKSLRLINCVVNVLNIVLYVVLRCHNFENGGDNAPAVAPPLYVKDKRSSVICRRLRLCSCGLSHWGLHAAGSAEKKIKMYFSRRNKLSQVWSVMPTLEIINGLHRCDVGAFVFLADPWILCGREHR